MTLLLELLFFLVARLALIFRVLLREGWASQTRLASKFAILTSINTILNFTTCDGQRLWGQEWPATIGTSIWLLLVDWHATILILCLQTLHLWLLLNHPGCYVARLALVLLHDEVVKGLLCSFTGLPSNQTTLLWLRTSSCLF